MTSVWQYGGFRAKFDIGGSASYTGRAKNQFKRIRCFENMSKFRNNGAIGAILDEYEKAITELDIVISDITDNMLIKIVDNETNNSDCKSIQTILTHLIRAGYIYVVEVRKLLGEEIEYTERKTFECTHDYRSELKKLFEYNEKLFTDYPNIKLEETDNEKKI